MRFMNNVLMCVCLQVCIREHGVKSNMGYGRVLSCIRARGYWHILNECGANVIYSDAVLHYFATLEIVKLLQRNFII